jgi:hypothetical protein
MFPLFPRKHHLRVWKFPIGRYPDQPLTSRCPPPADFHRPARTDNQKIGIFRGQTDVGSALVAGSSSYDAATGQYTIISAGYNIWYQRDEFRYLWKKMSGDVSLAADVAFPDPAGYNDRKAVLVIRQSLDDDSKEMVVALHGAWPDAPGLAAYCGFDDEGGTG